jgi:hypothetical protein
MGSMGLVAAQPIAMRLTMTKRKTRRTSDTLLPGG